MLEDFRKTFLIPKLVAPRMFLPGKVEENNTSPMRKGQIGIFLPGKGSEETSEPLPLPKGAPGELEKDFGEGPGAAGQEGMASQ